MDNIPFEKNDAGKDFRKILFILSGLNAFALVCFIMYSIYLRSLHGEAAFMNIGAGLILLAFFGFFIFMIVLQLIMLAFKPVKSNLLYGFGVIILNVSVVYFTYYLA